MPHKSKKIIFISMTGIFSLFSLLFSNNASIYSNSGEGCTHNYVEHYLADENHVEHWACCSCHTAWSDADKTNIIGNTISDRTKIDIPLLYTYNEITEKIEYSRGENIIDSITPTKYISSLKFHGNNNNVMQFKAGELKNYTTNGLSILNPQDISSSFNLSNSTKKSFIYWSDSETFGFQQSGAFTSYFFNSHIYCNNLILRDNNNYFVIGTIGTIFSEKHGTMKNVSGVFENKIINAMRSGNNYYVDLAAKIDTTFWSISGDSVGTDWTYSGGTSYLINKIHNNNETTFARVTPSTSNGTFPSGIVEATLNVRNQTIQNIRLGFDGDASFYEGDKLVLKAGSIFTDDGNGNDAVYVKEDITFIYTGTLFTLYLGKVNLANSEGRFWENNQLVISMPNVAYNLDYFYLNRCEGEWSSSEHAVLDKIKLEFTDVRNNIKHLNNNTYKALTYFNNSDLLGIKGNLDISDNFIPSLNDTLSIPENSLIAINCVGAFSVECGVTFVLSKITNDGATLCWTNTTNEDNYDMPTHDLTKSIHIGASNDLNSSKLIDHASGVVNTSILSDLQSGGFNLLTGNFSIIENDGHKNNLLDAGKNYNIDFILKPRSDWTTDQDYVSHNATNFLGYEMKDEPSIGDADSFKNLKQIFDTKSYKNKFFFTNLQPIYADSSYIGTDYEEYVRTFVEDCNFNILSYDNYSLYQDRRTSISSWSNTKIRDNWLKNFSICSYYANKNNIPFWYTFLSAQHYIGKNYRYIAPTSNEMAYQMYVAMAFGATGLVHYVLEHDGSNDTEGNKYGTTILDSSGNLTSTYTNAAQANHLVRTWDNIYMNYKWLGISGIVGSSKTYSGVLNDNLTKAIALNSTNILNDVSSTGDLLVSHFENGASHKAIMLTNYTMPNDNHTSSVTLNFNAKYDAVRVYQNDSILFQKLNNGSLSLNINPGSAVFITPVCEI